MSLLIGDTLEEGQSKVKCKGKPKIGSSPVETIVKSFGRNVSVGVNKKMAEETSGVVLNGTESTR